MDQISISKFKATCLAVLERVQQTRVPVLVTKRGVPVAEIKPPPVDGHRRLAWINGWRRWKSPGASSPRLWLKANGRRWIEMRLLLDTHIWIWSLIDPARLKPCVLSALDHRNADLWLSSISVWETLVLISKGRLRIKDGDGLRWIGEALKRSPLREASLTHCNRDREPIDRGRSLGSGRPVHRRNRAGSRRYAGYSRRKADCRAYLQGFAELMNCFLLRLLPQLSGPRSRLRFMRTVMSSDLFRKAASYGIMNAR